LECFSLGSPLLPSRFASDLEKIALKPLHLNQDRNNMEPERQLGLVNNMVELPVVNRQLPLDIPAIPLLPPVNNMEVKRLFF
jgi:hypothetical protein